ncbi:hypothetical protein ZWY2020_055429 [Hordeum vulgare]|nr:hypothetical protein ZWY2020_055429 [Hordeum vulgare]
MEHGGTHAPGVCLRPHRAHAAVAGVSAPRDTMIKQGAIKSHGPLFDAFAATRPRHRSRAGAAPCPQGTWRTSKTRRRGSSPASTSTASSPLAPALAPAPGAARSPAATAAASSRARRHAAPACCQDREALEAAPSGIVSGLDLGRLISSRSLGSLRKVAAEATAAGARVFTDLHDALPNPLDASNEEGEDRVGLEIIEKFPMR